MTPNERIEQIKAWADTYGSFDVDVDGYLPQIRFLLSQLDELRLAETEARTELRDIYQVLGGHSPSHPGAVLAAVQSELHSIKLIRDALYELKEVCKPITDNDMDES